MVAAEDIDDFDKNEEKTRWIDLRKRYRWRWTLICLAFVAGFTVLIRCKE
jgi:hypothetical protein